MPRKVAVTVAISVALAFGLFLGSQIEASTHALQVAQATGVSYARIIDRATVDTEENCADGPCESTQF